MTVRSESELSDVPEHKSATNHAIIPSTEDATKDYEEEEEDSAVSGDDGPGSDDAEFELEIEDPAEQSNHGSRDARSSSSESRPLKRKVGIEDNEEIMNNPELYGIRRSVCPEATCCNQWLLISV
jgi:chromodomain-helicase-DNA-binding protein 1